MNARLYPCSVCHVESESTLNGMCQPCYDEAQAVRSLRAALAHLERMIHERRELRASASFPYRGTA